MRKGRTWLRYTEEGLGVEVCTEGVDSAKEGEEVGLCAWWLGMGCRLWKRHGYGTGGGDLACQGGSIGVLRVVEVEEGLEMECCRGLESGERRAPWFLLELWT